MASKKTSSLSAAACETAPALVKNNTKDKIATPELSHLTAEDYEYVYEPAEDSFLLLDALESELPCLRQMRPTLAVEVGVGTGVASAALANALGSDCFVLGIDLNPRACGAAMDTAVANHVGGKYASILANGVEPPLAASEGPLEGVVDLVLCNPPYVDAPNEEILHHGKLAAAWAGGSSGRMFIDRLLATLPIWLASDGLCYLVLEQVNKPEEVAEYAKQFGLQSEKVMARRAGREFLSVWRIRREKWPIKVLCWLKDVYLLLKSYVFDSK